jgi:hypothetical protein
VRFRVRLKEVTGVLLAAALALAPAAAVRAAPDDGAAVLRVHVAGNGAMLANASVSITGPVQKSGLTDASGTWSLERAPLGVYRISAGARDFARSAVVDVDVTEPTGYDVRIQLVPTLKQIGSVTARTTVQTTHVGSASPEGAISESLNETLARLPGVSIDAGQFADGTLNVSLQGKDPSQTAVSVGGVQLRGASQGAALRALGTDLFTGATVDFSGSASAIAGRVGYELLEPTKAWRSSFTSSYSTFDRFSVAGALTGTAGKLGIATQFARRSTGSPVDGVMYHDLSGEWYSHDASERLSEELVRLRYPLGPRTTVSAVAILSNRDAAVNCPFFTEELPCGTGAGLRDTDRFHFQLLSLQTMLGNAVLDVKSSGYAGRSVQDRSAAMIAGVPLPYSDFYEYRAGSLDVSLSATAGRHQLAAHYSDETGHNAYRADGLRFSAPSAYDEHVRDAGVADSYKVSEKLTLHGELSLASNETAASALETLRLTWKPLKRDTVNLTFQDGSAQATGAGAVALSEPSLVTLTCQGISRLSGSGDPARPQFSNSYTVGWAHTFTGGSLNVGAYRQVQGGQNITAAVPLGSEPPGYLPSGYVDALRAAWNRSGACAGYPFDPDTFYVVSSVAGTVRRYEGVNVRARFKLGRNVLVAPSYATTAATLLAADARFASPFSFFRVGAQLPNVPLHSANLLLDVAQPRARLEWIANAQFVGANNGRHLGSYTQVNAGFVRALSRGTLTVFGSNLFDADAGYFWTTADAYALPLIDGAVAAQPAQPLLPRALTVQYSVKTGRKE